MELNESHIFENQKSKVKLIFESFEEPNYGRTFWKYKLYINGIIANDKLLNYENEGLSSTLESFVLSSDDNNYIFIPKYKPLVYNVTKNEFKEFKAPLEEGSRRLFKNYFNNNKLILIYRKGIAIINLETKNMQSFEDANYHIEDATHINDKEIGLDYLDLTDYEYKKKIIKITV